MTLVGDLFALQEIDSAIDQRVARIEEIRARATESEEVAAVRAEVEERRAGLPEIESLHRDLDTRVTDLRARIAPVESKLYGGSVHSPRELQDLQQDLEQLQRQRQALEDQLLEVMERLEAKRREVAEAEARLHDLESTWSAQQFDGRAEVDQLEQEVAALRARRDAQVGKVPSTATTTYDRVRRRRRGLAVVKVERGTCLGCRLSLPPAIVQRARSSGSREPVHCPSCERILYVL
jgi:uncharacterized protein